MSTTLLGRWFRLSLSVQLVLATLLAVLPLVVALSYAALSLGRQIREQHQLVLSMAALNHLDASVSEQVKGLERAARQYRLLREPRFRQRYDDRLAELERSHGELIAMPGLDTEPEVLRRLLEVMEALGVRLGPEFGNGGEQEDLQPLLQQAYDLSALLSQQIGERLRTSLSTGEQRFNATLGHLFVIGVLAIPGTVLLVTIGTLAISAPVRRLAQAIRNLGYRRWQQPVAINGPAELLELGEWLDWMRRKLLASENRSQALLQHITHELKSPLAAITEASSLLADGVPGDLTPAQQRVLEILRSNAAHLHELIRQLLSYNAVNQRDGDCREPVDLKALCARQQAQLEGMGEGMGGDHQIRWRYPDRSLTVTADPLALQMVVANLLSNAFHYSPRAGEIRVDWGEEDSSWWLSVSDEGPGIPAGELPNIFKLFYRGAINRERSGEGSGIGLAIVEECVKAMGGKVRVQSAPGEGSSFRVECPRAKQELEG
ncbi:sensor histidine kinase [Kineobactrum salinum]|uniref:histidine kinase n=1 Tax=Kineobactrum salinum TaxID=2708301 RepID=A0A6C0U329_9GAMM|nr:HAMP domain-containing sensor histidine kinase [Kineobactrum salinum]QIB65377.1 HAMP domain-containing histidine kinase [Kineobactrum salinum]